MPAIPMFDFNRFRNSEILNEDIRDREGANELARKLIQTYANDTAKTNQEVPSPSDQAILDRYITGFLNAVVFEYGKMVRGEEPNVETLITRWNVLATFFNNDINSLYSYYVINKLDSDIVARIEDLKEWNDDGNDEEGNLNFNVNKGAMDMLYRYTKNGVIRPIPYSLIYSKDDLSTRRLARIEEIENERRGDFSPPPSPIHMTPATMGLPTLLPPAIARAIAAPVPAGTKPLTKKEKRAIAAVARAAAAMTPPASPTLMRPVARVPIVAPVAAPIVAAAPKSLFGITLPSFGKKKKGKGRNATTKHAHPDASLGRTPSGYTTSQSYPSRLSEKTVKASYGKGLPKGFVVF